MNTTPLVMHASKLVISNVSRCRRLIYPVIGVSRAEDSGKGTKECCWFLECRHHFNIPLFF